MLYVPLLGFSSALLFLRTFVYARLFEIADFGLLNQALLIATTFTSLAGLGLYHLAQKLLPQYHVLGEEEKFDALVGSCITVGAISAAVAIIAIAVAVSAGWLHRDLAFVAVVPFAAGQYLFTLRLNELKSELRFIDHALVSGMRAALALAVGVGVAWYTRSVAATLAVEALVTLVIVAPKLFAAHGATVRQQLRSLRSGGSLTAYYPAAFRLLWLNGAIAAVYTVDRWFGVALLTKREYGFFALGLTVIALFETLQAIVNVAAYPLMGRMIARGQFRRAFRFANLGSAAVVVCSVLVYVPFVFVLDYLLHRFLPSYVEAAPVIRLAVIVGMLRLADFYTTYLVLLDRERRMTLAYAALLAASLGAISLAGPLLGIRFNPERMIQATLGIATGAYLMNLGISVYASRRTPDEVAGKGAQLT